MDDVRAVLDAAGSRRTVLWGAGPDGGALCAMFAATYPERVAALAFWNAAARTAWAPDYPWGGTPEVFEAFDDAVERAWGSDELAPDLMRVVGIPSLADDPEARRWFAKACRAMGSPGDVLAFDAMWNEIDFRSILPSIRVPTLCLYEDETGADGTTEAGLSNGGYEFLAHGIAGARSVKLPAGDFPPWTSNTVAAVGALRDFVASVRQQEADLDRVLATVLFTDIVDSTGTAAAVGDAKWRGLIDEHDRLARAVVERFRGEHLESRGDGVMATFDGPARAVRCARALGDALRPLGLEIRAGAHTCEVERVEHGIAGIGVHVAARVAARAGAGEVWASSTVRDLTAGSGLRFEDRGEHELKGVPDRWRLYRVVAG
jgi:class 3 adenylate cyclase